MRELRTCPVTGVTVLLNDAWPEAPAPARAARGACWACAGPGPVIARAGEVVAVPHPTPALGVEGDVRPRTGGPGVRRDAVGAHELLFGAHAGGDAPLLRLAAARIDDLRGDTRLRGFALLREALPAAHAAWQLFAFPTVVAPTDARAWRDRELAEGTRVVATAPGAAAIAAWAPRRAFETWIVPTDAGEWPVAIEPVAALAGRVTAAMHRLLGGAPVHLTVAWGDPWRLVLRPEVANAAPTRALDLPAVGVFPERAAALLRAEPALR
jgi:hypothetical protein